MDGTSWNTWGEGAAFGLENGMAVIPYALLKHYRKLNLTGSEAMLLIHLLSFRQVEGIDFPSLEELQAVTGRSIPVIAGELQKLMKEGFISIDGDNDELRDIHYERYNFSGLYAKLGAYLAKVKQESGGGAAVSASLRRPGTMPVLPCRMTAIAVRQLQVQPEKVNRNAACSAFSRRNSAVRCPRWNASPSPAGWTKTAIPRS